MKNLKYIISTLVLFGFINTTITAQTTIPASDPQIVKETKNILNEYSKFSAFTSNGESINPVYVDGFLALFNNLDNEAVLNDLSPVSSEVTLVSANEYVQKVKYNYKQGLSVNIDMGNLNISDAYIYKKKRYRYNVTFNKSIFGLYRDEQLHDVTKSLTIQISFLKTSSGLSDFKIEKIQDDKNAEDITIIKERKFALGFSIIPQQSTIFSENISSNEYWATSEQITVGGGLVFSRKLSDRLNLNLGLQYSEYKTNFDLKDYSLRSEESRIDVDNDTYFLEVDADLEEECTQTFLQIPINIEFIANPNSKIKFYAYGGINVAYTLSSTCYVKGSSTTRGYYPEYNVLLEDIPEYGFRTESYDQTGDWELNSINILANGGVGVMLPVGLHSVMKLSPNYTFSITDFKYEIAKYDDDYLKNHGTPGKTGVSGLGFMISMLFYL